MNPGSVLLCALCVLGVLSVEQARGLDKGLLTWDDARGWFEMRAKPSSGGNAMCRILAFTSSPEDWRLLLADPERQWKLGRSARALAYCWEAASGFPPEVTNALRTDDRLLADLAPILAVPEFKVPLRGRGHPSQNDIFVLARSSAGPVSIMVEGKAGEPFGPTVEEWRGKPSPDKEKRLSFVLHSLGLDASRAGAIRYQLLHRAASAVITGKQYRAVAAVLLVQSFSMERIGWPDYQSFTRLFGVEAVEGQVQRLDNDPDIPLFGVWVVGDCSFLER